MLKYTWEGKEYKVKNTLPLLAQAYIALLDDAAIEERAWMREKPGTRLTRFVDNTETKTFRFDMQKTYRTENDNEKFYCIQMQINRESKSGSAASMSPSSCCDVQISEHASPSPALFRAACWSSARECDKQAQSGKFKAKTMKVIISRNNTWKNEETEESGSEPDA